MLPAVRILFNCPRSIRAATAAADLLPRFLLTRLSPAFPGALTAPAPVLREETITAPLPCCECTQTDVPYTHLFCARREGLQDRMTHAHACSDCVVNKGRKTDRLIYTSRFVHVIYSSCIVPNRPGTVAFRLTVIPFR